MSSPFPQIHLPPGSFDLLPVAELKTKFHPENNNTHPASQLALYAEVLRAGIRRAAVLSARSGLLVMGHGAILTAEAEGWEKYPVQVQAFESEEAELAFLLADNELPKLSKRADPKTVQILSRLREKTGFSLSATGMKSAIMERLLAKSGSAPLPGASPKTDACKCPHCGQKLASASARECAAASSARSKAKRNPGASRRPLSRGAPS